MFTVPDPHDWRDDELGYCQELVRNGGDENVPFSSIGSYLAMQMAAADRDKRQDVWGFLHGLRETWDQHCASPEDIALSPTQSVLAAMMFAARMGRHLVLERDKDGRHTVYARKIPHLEDIPAFLRQVL